MSKRHKDRITGDAGPYQKWLFEKLGASQGTELTLDGFLSKAEMIASAGIVV